MAATLVPIESLELFNHWGGPHRVNWLPDDLNDAGTTKLWPLCTTIALYNHLSATGWSEFVYLKLSHPDATYPVIFDHIVVNDSTTPVHGEVTNDLTRGAFGYNSGLIGICSQASVLVNEYAWFWCGGTYPVDYCPSLVGTDIGTNGSIALGSLMILANAGTAGATYGEIGLAPQSETTFKMPVGYSLAVDA